MLAFILALPSLVTFRFHDRADLGREVVALRDGLRVLCGERPARKSATEHGRVSRRERKHAVDTKSVSSEALALVVLNRHRFFELLENAACPWCCAELS
jgi:hypothetical protein